MSGARIAVFLANVLAIWAGMHFYVFWRASSVPWIASSCPRQAWWWLGLGLWASYPLARWLQSLHTPLVATPFEFLASTWVGTLFIIFAALLTVEVLTLGGYLWPQMAPSLRGWAIAGALLLAVVALVQGARPASVIEHEVRLPGLPKSADGKVLVVLSDLHLSSLTTRNWVKSLVQRVNDLRPDLVMVAGDVIDGREEVVRPMLDDLRQIHAPLGMWAVTGNHDFYSGDTTSARLIEFGGMKLLRDAAAPVAPGLWVAGVDDLTARPDRTQSTTVVRSVLRQTGPGAVIFACHTPELMPVAAECGAGLMLSGHTHNGQIWPFNFLVHLRYRYITGRHAFGPMTLLIGNGTGTWGPRMRLWTPGQILRVTLRSAEAEAREPQKET